MPITDEHIEEWRREGYVVIPDFLTPDELAAAQADLARILPSWDDYMKQPVESGFPGGLAHMGYLVFPFAGDNLNRLSVHRGFLSAAERILGTSDLRLSKSEILAKYATVGDYDQPLHLDYGNNTLVTPSTNERLMALTGFIYLTDVTADLGPTYLVSQRHTRDEPVDTPMTRESRPDLYELERPVICRAGTALLYDLRTYHRGSAMTASRGVRFTHHLVLRAAGTDYMQRSGFGQIGIDPNMIRFLEQASPRERELVGFPSVDDEYWTPQTVREVAARYKGMDMSPYQEALSAKAR